MSIVFRKVFSFYTDFYYNYVDCKVYIKIMKGRL